MCRILSRERLPSCRHHCRAAPLHCHPIRRLKVNKTKRNKNKNKNKIQQSTLFGERNLRGRKYILILYCLLSEFTITTCGASGALGPNYSQCESYYLNSSTRAAVFENEALNLNGSQMWTVPRNGHYT